MAALLTSRLPSPRLAGALLLTVALMLGGCSGGGSGGAQGPSAVAEQEPVADPAATQPVAAWTGGVVSRFGIHLLADGRKVGISVLDAGSGSPSLVRSYSFEQLGGFTSAVYAEPTGRFVYARLLNMVSTAIELRVYGIDATSGVLGLPGMPAAAPQALAVGASDPGELVFPPAGGLAFIADAEAGIRSFTVASDGRLVAAPGSPAGGPFPAAASPRLVAHPSGRLLFASRADAPVAVYRVESNGAISPLPRTPPGTADERGGIVLAGAQHAWLRHGDGSWALHAVDENAGLLAPVQPALTIVASPGATGEDTDPAIVADAAGRFLLVGRMVPAAPGSATRHPELQAHAFDAASLSLSPIGAPLRSLSLLPVADPHGPWFRDGDVVLRVDASGLQPSAVSALERPDALVAGATPAVRSAYTAALDPGASVLRMLSVNSASGALRAVPAGTASLPGTPVALAASRDGRTVAVASASATAGYLSVFEIDPDSGRPALTASIATGPGPTAVGIDARSDDNIQVSHRGGIDLFFLAADGSLQASPSSPYPIGFGPLTTGFLPDGSFGVIGPGPAIRDHVAATDLLAGRGGHLFVGAVTDLAPQDFFFATTTGGISTLVGDGSRLAGSASGVGQCPGRQPRGSTFHPSGNGPAMLAAVGGGRLVYAVHPESGQVAGYHGQGGMCLPVPWMSILAGSPFPGPSRPAAIAADPLGRFLFVANADLPASVSVYVVDPATGGLVAAPGSPFALRQPAQRLWLDAAGRFLFTSDAAGVVRVQALERASGALGSQRLAAPGLTLGRGLDIPAGLR